MPLYFVPEFALRMVVHFFWLDPKETEPKKRSRLHFYLLFDDPIFIYNLTIYYLLLKEKLCLIHVQGTMYNVQFTIYNLRLKEKLCKSVFNPQGQETE